MLGGLSSLLQLALGNALVPTFKLPPATLAFNFVNIIFVVGSQGLAHFRAADFLAPSIGAADADPSDALDVYGYTREN